MSTEFTPQITPEQIEKLRAVQSRLPDAQKRELAELLEKYAAETTKIKAKDDFITFIKHVYPGYKVGPHHRKLAKIFEDIAHGVKKRVIVNIAPRHGKSEMISYLAPAWFLGKYPEKKVIMASHTADLAVNFGRRVRNLVGSELYHDIFPSVELQADSKSASRWGTNANGEYFAIGVGGALAGRGADLFIIDDPHSEQQAMQGRADVFEPAWEWFQSGPIQRLMPGGAIIVVMTRWSKLDLTGQIIDHMTKNEDSDEWEVVEFPAIFHDKPLWPEFWTLDELLAKKAGMDPRYWHAQYMQNPVSNNAAIIARSKWRIWPTDEPPQCEYVIQSWDTAFEAKTTADYSACTTWGVFYNEEERDQAQLILLDAFKDRMAFPELKQYALKHYKEWEPDAFIVEKKAAGAPLIQELRAMGIPVQETNPSRGNDKVVRLNAVSDLFASGMVWAPDTRWAREVIEEVASFPNGEHDDFVDTTSQALMRFRQGGFIPMDSDEKDEPSYFRRRTYEYY